MSLGSKFDRKAFGSRVKMLREKREWSQETLAVRSDLSEKTIRNVENTKRVVTVETIWKLAHGFGMDPKDLLFPPS